MSGRDEDKVAKAGLTPAFDQAGPYFEEASLVFVCRKAYVQAFEEGCFVDRSQLDRWYPERDLHTMYVGLVEKVLVKNRGAKEQGRQEKGAGNAAFPAPLAAHALCA